MEILHLNKQVKMERWKPGVPKSILLLIAGLIWIGIGVMLDYISFSWLRAVDPGNAVLALVFGFLSALIIHHFGFLRIVDKNLGRILPMRGKQCVFSFMPWKSYIVIIIMVCIGVFLRNSSIPKVYLSVLYCGIGTALILSSIRYLRYLIFTIRNG
jgi:hypothetical protein